MARVAATGGVWRVGAMDCWRVDFEVDIVVLDAEDAEHAPAGSGHGFDEFALGLGGGVVVPGTAWLVTVLPLGHFVAWCRLTRV